MSETFYKKVGNRYIPVSEFEPDFRDSFTEGAYLVISNPGVTIYRKCLQPENANMLAAMLMFEEVLATEIVKHSELRASIVTELTPDQMEAFQKFKESVGGAASLMYPSAQEIAKNCAEKMAMKVANLDEQDLENNENIRDAFNYFLSVCKLSKASTK